MENSINTLTKLNKELITLQDEYDQIIYHLESLALHVPDKVKDPFKEYEAKYLHEIKEEIRIKKEFLFLLNKATHFSVFQESLENAIDTLNK